MKQQISESRWEYMQRLGKNKYIFFYGIVIYGLLLFMAYHLTLLLSNMYTSDNFSVINYISDKNNHIRFISSFILFILMGLYLSSSAWKKHERKHKDEN
jgi:hypothetical protein